MTTSAYIEFLYPRDLKQMVCGLLMACREEFLSSIFFTNFKKFNLILTPFHTFAVTVLNLTYLPNTDSHLILRSVKSVLLLLQGGKENWTSSAPHILPQLSEKSINVLCNCLVLSHFLSF